MGSALERGRPDWWPAGEPWPPRHGRGIRLARRIRLLAGLLLLLPLVGMVAVAVAFHAGGHPASAATVLVILVLGLLLLVALVAALSARRWVGPLAELIDAAQRVEDGDYSVRLPERAWGPPTMRELVHTFNTMTEHLEVSERQRRSLLADIGHELRTPLAVLQGELEAILDGVHPADEAHLSIALEETRVLARLIDDLRTLTLAEAGTLPLHREPVDLAVLATEVASGLQLAAADDDKRLAVSVAEDLPLVDLDPVRMREVLANLASNALRYAPPGSAVRIEAARARDRITISVADSGPGIAPEVLPHIFDRFTKSADSRGSGLGLAITRQLVEAHGGAISVETGAAGTTMRVELPVERAEA